MQADKRFVKWTVMGSLLGLRKAGEKGRCVMELL